MPRIPNIQRFKEDHKVSISHWLSQFEAQISALGIEDDQRLQMLLCCIESSAFTVVSRAVASNAELTYDETIDLLQENFGSEEYRRTLENKFFTLKFQRGTPITTFADNLRAVVQELYNLDINDTDAIEAIALNHVIANLDDEQKRDIKILYIAGNTSLENVLEFVESRSEPSLLAVNKSTLAIDIKQQNSTTESRVDSLEKMFAQFLVKIEAIVGCSNRQENSKNE